VGGDAGESEIDGSILWRALPESDEVGLGFVETAWVVAVAQGAGKTELILGVGGIAGECGTEGGDGVVVSGGSGVGETLSVERTSAGLLIQSEAGDQMADRGEGDGRGESKDDEYDGRGAGDKFGERPRHVCL